MNHPEAREQRIRALSSRYAGTLRRRSDNIFALRFLAFQHGRKHKDAGIRPAAVEVAAADLQLAGRRRNMLRAYYRAALKERETAAAEKNAGKTRY